MLRVQAAAHAGWKIMQWWGLAKIHVVLQRRRDGGLLEWWVRRRCLWQRGGIWDTYGYARSHTQCLQQNPSS